MPPKPSLNKPTYFVKIGVVNSQPETVFVKFSTKIWTGAEVFYHYYESPWETVKKGEIYTMNRSNIKEVAEPDWEWF